MPYLLKTLDSTLFDLADAFFGKIIFLADLLNGYTVLSVQAK